MPDPADLTNATDARRPRFTWTWPRLLLTGFLLCLSTVAAWILYDQPLESAEDLAPTPVAAVPPAENGWEFLRTKWEALPKMPDKQKTRMMELLSGSVGWDESEESLTAVAITGKERLAELEQALAFPAWQAPVWDPAGPYVSPAWIFTALRPGYVLYLEQIHAGHLTEAAAYLRSLLAVGRRGLPAEPSLIAMLVDVSQISAALAAAPHLLNAAGPEHAALCRELQEELAVDWITPEMVSNCGRREATANRKLLLDADPKTFASLLGAPGEWKYRLFFKRNTTANHSSRYFRVADELWLKPVTAGAESIHLLKTERERIPAWRRWSGGNPLGEKLTDGTLDTWNVLDSAARRMLFLQRAMAVRIALHRWKLAHGSLPAKLTELVPDFLAAVPVDPWDGRPLRWDPARFGGMLYSVGQDLTDDPGQSFDHGKMAASWLDSERNCPAIRLELPAPPPPRSTPVTPAQNP